MIDIKEIEDEITRLEHCNTTYSNCEKLSVLYAVRDKLRAPEQEEQGRRRYSYAAEPDLEYESEFLQAVNQSDLQKALLVIDAHMSAIKLLYPKEYNAIIRKIKGP